MSISDQIKGSYIAAGLREPVVQKRGHVWIAGYLDDHDEGPCVAIVGLEDLSDAERERTIVNGVQTFVSNFEGERHPITESDFIAPLVLLRCIAEQEGVTLTGEDEQRICREITEAITSALFDEVKAKA